MRFALLFLLLGACAPTATRPAPVATTERNAKLSPTEGAIGGIILDSEDGKPLSMVSIQADQNGKRVAHDISDHEGRYRLGPLEPGLYDVSAKFADARVAFKDIKVVKVQETEVGVNIDLRNHGDTTSVTAIGGNLGSIVGVVLDGPRGKPFPGTAVSLSAPHLEDVVMTITDADAAFTFRGLRPGTYALSAYYTLVDQNSIEVRRGNIEVRPGKMTSVELVLELKLR